MESHEHPFATLLLVNLHEVDALRRSLAIGGSLTIASTEELLEACRSLLVQQAQIEEVLSKLGPTFRETRAALNDLARIVRRGQGPGQ
jgi:hypothetical protein